MSECAGDLERGSIRNLKINALSARKSMGLIGMPIGPVKTIKREEKCLTTSSLLLTQTQRESGTEGGLKRNIRGRQSGMRWSDIWEGKAQEGKLKA